jgi:hypothetical protein
MADPARILSALQTAAIKRAKRTSLVGRLENELERAECPDDVRIWLCGKSPAHVQRWIAELIEGLVWPDEDGDQEDEEDDRLAERDP